MDEKFLWNACCPMIRTMNGATPVMPNIDPTAGKQKNPLYIFGLQHYICRRLFLGVLNHVVFRQAQDDM
jgi:hypothetical protein